MTLDQAKQEYAICLNSAVQCFRRALKEERNNRPDEANHYWSAGLFWQGQATRDNVQKALALY